MNKTFTLLISFLLLAASGFALENRLTISSNSNTSIRVLIDGRAYQPDNARSEREISLTDLRPGIRNIKIYMENNPGRSRPGYNNRADRNMQLIYNANLYIRDGVDVDLSINRFGKVFIDEQVLDRTYGNNNRYDDEYGGGDWNRGNQPMNDRAFLQLKQSLAREQFEDARLNIAKRAINSFVSSSQVKELMAQFNFENNKLDLAKYCYRFATDKQYYYSVADGLNYSNSKNELMRFIQQQR
jgi:hypothetical protein